MILIADCGSTKIDWCLIEMPGAVVARRFETPGVNAVMLTLEEMASRFGAELQPQVADVAQQVSHVYFYGAGCISPQVCGNVAAALSESLPMAEVEVYTDLLAAARALCGNAPGIACIMGTGSNSCYYDGEKIAANVSPLGFILGDEGSGAVLGKLLVGNVLKRQLPADLCDKFMSQYSLDLLTIIDRVYRKPMPQRFLASLSPFILENIDRPEVKAMALDAFKAFFVRNIANYEYAHQPDAKVNFIGSIAHYYREVIEEAAQMCGFKVGQITKSPMEGLIKFHTAD